MSVDELEHLTRQMMADFDALNTKAMIARMSQDVQGVDEIARRWMRGRAAAEEYFGQLEGAVSDVSSTISDVHAIDHGDVGIVTCMIDQTYRFGGQPVAVTAPMTVIFVRESSEWKVALVSAVPLGDEPAG
jgi:ketosteroid isomerase-like protein